MHPAFEPGKNLAHGSPRDERSRNQIIILLLFLMGGVALFTVLEAPALTPGWMLTLHTQLELVSIALGAAIFLAVWNGQGEKQNRSMQAFGAACLAVALLDAGHVLSYPGMPDFVTPPDMGKSLVFWLAARLLQALALLGLVYFSVRLCRHAWERHAWLAGALLLVGGVSWVALIHSAWLPMLYVPEAGLTPARLGMEYLIVGTLALVALILSRRIFAHEQFDSRYLLMATLSLIFSELCLILSGSGTGSAIVLGHVYKIAAAFFLYRAVFVETVRTPFRKMLESQQYFSHLLEIMPDGVVLVDHGGRIVRVNGAAEQMFHCAREDLLGKAIEVLIPQRYRTGHVVNRAAYAANATVREMGNDLRLTAVRQDNGEEFPVEVALSPVGQAGIGGVMCVVRDQSKRAQIEQRVQQQEQQLRALTESQPEIVSRFDRDHRMVYVNRAIEKVDGKPRELYLNKRFDELGNPDALIEIWNAQLQKVFDTGQTVEFEYAYDSLRGRRHYLGRLAPEFAPDGTVDHVLAISQDITSRVRAQAENRRLTILLDATPDLVFVTDLQGALLYLNPAGRAMLGWPSDLDIRYVKPYSVYPERAVKRLRESAMPHAAAHGIWQGENTVVREGGKEIPVIHTLLAHKNEEGRVMTWSHIIQDFSERKQMESQLLHQATHDKLTGLPNRSVLLEHIRQGMFHAQRAEKMMAVMFIDLDDFKTINDSLGHDAGDAMLAEVACRLKRAVRAGDTICRLGGDEFTVVMESMENVSDVAATADKLQAVLKQPYVLQGGHFSASTSIGITLYPLDGDAAEDLLRNADIAMYQAKRQRKGSYHFYTAGMNDSIRAQLELKEDMRRGIGTEEFVLHYQPKIDFQSGQITGMEALVRWQHPERGLLPPDVFIPLAEESGLISPLGEWILRTACRQARAWQLAGLPGLRVAVNLSARQFAQDDLVGVVEQVLQEAGLAAEYLELEITESMLMKDADHAVWSLFRLKELGVTLSIDDFGTGYSSLSYLRSFPVGYLKIDRSFVRDATSNANDAAIVRAIISMAHQLGLKVVAEGVETEAHCTLLRECGCDQMQGYLISVPLPAEKFEQFVRESDAFNAVGASV
jgi:diguanylate cyclase (GGDEF)-like protein/PAS domain S-box-containing protein